MHSNSYWDLSGIVLPMISLIFSPNWKWEVPCVQKGCEGKSGTISPCLLWSVYSSSVPNLTCNVTIGYYQFFWFWHLLTINVNQCAITCNYHWNMSGPCSTSSVYSVCRRVWDVVTSYYASDPPSEKLAHRDKCSESMCRRPDSCSPWARSSLSTIFNSTTHQTCIMLVCCLHWAGSVALSVSKSTSW